MQSLALDFYILGYGVALTVKKTHRHISVSIIAGFPLCKFDVLTPFPQMTYHHIV